MKTEQGLFLRFRIDDEKLYKVLDDLEKARKIIGECPSNQITIEIIGRKVEDYEQRKSTNISGH